LETSLESFEPLIDFLAHCFPTFSGLQHPTERKYDLQHPVANA